MISRSKPTLRTLLTDAGPAFALPSAVMRQLVGYYTDWRRSRDILSDPDEPRTRRRIVLPEIARTNGLRSLRLR